MTYLDDLIAQRALKVEATDRTEIARKRTGRVRKPTPFDDVVKVAYKDGLVRCVTLPHQEAADELVATLRRVAVAHGYGMDATTWPNEDSSVAVEFKVREPRVRAPKSADAEVAAR